MPVDQNPMLYDHELAGVAIKYALEMIQEKGLSIETVNADCIAKARRRPSKSQLLPFLQATTKQPSDNK
jgi:hypothetical protein